MQDILIKYGIPRSILSRSQNESFEKYAEDAKKRELEAFNDFLKAFEKRRITVQNRFDSVCEQINIMIIEALTLTEKAVPNSSSSLLSAFGNAPDKKDSEQMHVDLLLGLSKIISDLNIPVDLCAKIITDACDDLLVELKLRYAAVCEFLPDTELCEKYSALTKGCEKFSREAIISRASEYSKLISAFICETDSFCQDADIAFKSTKENKTLYTRTARDFINRIHGLSLKLREIKGDTNAKI